MNKNGKKNHHKNLSINIDYRLPIANPLLDYMDMKHTTFPTTAYEAGVINISSMVELNKRSVINKPEPEFYRKYYEIKNNNINHKKNTQ